MPRPSPCRGCRAALEPAQEFAYLVEVQTLGDPVMLAAIRRLPHRDGRPLRVCRRCQAAIERRAAGRPPAVSPPVVALAAVGLVAVATALGRWLGGGPG